VTNRKEVSHGILICPESTTKQIACIIEYLDIKDRIKPFTRCLLCNSPLEHISKKIEDRIPPRTKEFCDEYVYWEKCDKIYCKGTVTLELRPDEIRACLGYVKDLLKQ